MDDTSETEPRPTLVKPLPHNRALILKNLNCAYCGRLFNEQLPPTKEHVIGGRFVPRGCLHGQWNLILKACGRCNGDKANLEDDISIITTMPDAFGRHAIDDNRLRDDVIRKAAKARSRFTGKLVRDSREHFEMNGAFGQTNSTSSSLHRHRSKRPGFFGWPTITSEAFSTGSPNKPMDASPA